MAIETLRDKEWILGLHDFCHKLVTSDSVIVELGSFSGESTAVFAQYAQLVYAVDPWLPNYHQEVLLGCANQDLMRYINEQELQEMPLIEQIFDKRLSNYLNVKRFKMTESDAITNFNDFSVDIVYIDAIHTSEQVSSSIIKWRRKVKPNGYISGHDYSVKDWPGVVAAVDSHFGRPHLLFADTSWAVQLSKAP